jgi:predicted permease
VGRGKKGAKEQRSKGEKAQEQLTVVPVERLKELNADFTVEGDVMIALLRAFAIRVIGSLLRRRTDVDEELRSHLEMAIEWNLRQGLTPEEARRRALLDLGGIERTKELYRDQGGLPMLESVLQDARYGLRMLAANRSFTAMAVLSLALGIGANTAIFSLLYALLLRPLPVPNPGELLQVKITIAGKEYESFSYPVIRALGERKNIFAALGGFSGAILAVGAPSDAVRTSGAWVSGGFFPALQLTPAAGRLLREDDDRPGAPPVAVITDAYWDRVFQRSPDAVGATLLVEGHPVTVVGVAPPGFTGANVGEDADLTLPFQAMPQLFPRSEGLQAGNQYNRILARPAQGLAPEQVRARLKVAWPAMASVSATPKMPAKRREAMLASTLDVEAGGTGWTPLRNQYTKPLTVLMAISALVLLLACINVANLLLARSAARGREFAIRAAIGAGRARVIRQLLIESLLLSFLGSALGLMVARAGSTLLLTRVSQSIQLDAGLNLPVLGFAVAVAALSGVLFGLAPALRSSSGGANLALRTGSASGQTRGGLVRLLVTMQVAVSLLLLIGAGLFTRTLRNLQEVDPGFRHEGVLMADVDSRQVVRGGAEANSRRAAMFRDGLEALSGLHGVSAAAVSNYTPISGGYWSQMVQVRSQAASDEEAIFFAVSPGFFAALSMPFKMGRDFSMRDDGSAPPVAIVNEEFVRRFLRGDRNALGELVSASDSQLWKNMQIVGVVANSRPYSLREAVRPCVYVPFFQQPTDRIGFGTFEVKVSGSLRSVGTAIEKTLMAQVSGLPITARPFTTQVEGSMRREILMAELAGFFGVLALILAAVGLYGLLAYTVARRTSEVGIRIALGARASAVVWMMLAQGMRPVAAGVLVGLPVAWWACRFVAALLYGMRPFDAVTIVGAVATLGLVALGAAWVPARRAAKVDPMVALRQE